ncbi:MAG: hypothetical protein Q9222_000592 [Ikaeria aurantiellina]
MVLNPPASNNLAARFAFHTAPETDLRIPNELADDPNPATVRARADVANQKQIERYLYNNIEEVKRCNWQLVNHHWPDGIEQNLKRTKESFAEDGIEKKSLEGCWEISVEAIDPERFVVSQVVGLSRQSVAVVTKKWRDELADSKSGAIRQSNGQIGKHSKESIRSRGLEREIVRYLVDGEE